MGMRKLFFFVVLLFYSLINVFAQPTTFMKTYINGNSGYAVREINGNTYVVAGCTDFYYNFHWNGMSPIANTNIHLFKTNSDGILIWEKIFQLAQSRSLATWMEPSNDGGMIITGRSNNDLVWPPDSNDVVVIKCDADGIIQWSKTYDSGKDELGFCVRQTMEGGYAISAFHDAMPMSLTGTTYAMLIKTDASGNVEWNKSYELAVRDLDTGEGLTWVFSQTADSGYVMTGTTVGAHQADLYVIRVNKAGDLMWAKSYEHDNSVNRFSLGLDVIESRNKEIIIAGSMDKDHSQNEYNYPHILKLDSTGGILRAAIYNSIPTQAFQSGFSSVVQCPDNGFLFTGMGGYGGFGQQAQILKTDSAFNMEWSRSYTNDGLATMGSRSGRRTSDGSYIFTGKKFTDGAVLLKTDFIGLVPCKNPAALIEITPSILVVDRYPATISGIVSTDILFNVLLSSIDTTTECPVIISHLPVELTSFIAKVTKQGNVLVSWETASEINNDYFILEKSQDGLLFTTVTTIKGAGNSTNANEYSFLDENNSAFSIIYYRLKQVDYDGKTNFSSILTVAVKPDEFKLLHIFSDSQNNKITIHLNSDISTQLKICVTDILGKKQLDESVRVEKGQNFVRLDAKNLERGIYFYALNNGREQISGKALLK